jgi:hypothetical protein
MHQDLAGILENGFLRRILPRWAKAGKLSWRQSFALWDVQTEIV